MVTQFDTASKDPFIDQNKHFIYVHGSLFMILYFSPLHATIFAREKKRDIISRVARH